MTTEYDQALYDHLNSKLRRGETRKTISLKEYDHDLAVIITALRNVITLPENVHGILGFIIFGSWARRDDFTRPTRQSDLDLLAISEHLLAVHQFQSVGNLVKARLHRPKDISLIDWIGPWRVERLYRGEHEYVKHGFIEVR